MNVSGGDLRARDAMVTEPLALEGSATAPEAGRRLKLTTVVDGSRRVLARSSYRLVSSIWRRTLACTTWVPTPRLRTSRPRSTR